MHPSQMCATWQKGLLNTLRGKRTDVTFREEDARHVHYPHKDSLVVNAMIGGMNLYRMLFDDGSSVNILAYSTY